MRFLAFDIECARVSKIAAHILSFGYVLADENFGVLLKEDLLVNPATKIRVRSKSGDGIDLPYTDAELKNAPRFPAVYGKIRALLEDPENVVIGHAATNDARYLNLDAERYGLAPLSFSYYDTQVFYAEEAENFSALRGLDALCKEEGAEFTPHCSMDDAEMTLFLLKRLCEKRKTDFCGLIRETGAEPGVVDDYTVKTATTAKFREILAERAKKKEEKRLAWERSEKNRRKKAANAEK